jgi:hypothetical protein
LPDCRWPDAFSFGSSCCDAGLLENEVSRHQRFLERGDLVTLR